jgi:hypothetical protein
MNTLFTLKCSYVLGYTRTVVERCKPGKCLCKNICHITHSFLLLSKAPAMMWSSRDPADHFMENRKRNHKVFSFRHFHQILRRTRRWYIPRAVNTSVFFFSFFCVTINRRYKMFISLVIRQLKCNYVRCLSWVSISDLPWKHFHRKLSWMKRMRHIAVQILNCICDTGIFLLKEMLHESYLFFI